MERLIVDSDSDDEFLEGLMRISRKKKNIRNRPNHFDEWNDEEFYNRFRLTKNTTIYVLRLIQDDIAFSYKRKHSLSEMNQLLLALRFYAKGSMLISIGDFSGVHKSTAGRIIERVSEAIASLSKDLIKMPENIQSVREKQHSFHKIAAFPRVTGCIDCTHIRIGSLGGNNAEDYRNRKGFFSLNVQTVCDAKLNIMNIVARWPGSSHDSTIFNNSLLKANFEDRRFDNGVLLGDSGYTPTSYLLTPIRNPLSPEESLYNESHIRTRNTVERQYGVWKRRFPALALGMRLNIRTVQSVVVLCAVLHNIANGMGEAIPPLEEEIERRLNIAMEEGQIQVAPMNEEGPQATRQAFIEYFRELREN